MYTERIDFAFCSEFRGFLAHPNSVRVGHPGGLNIALRLDSQITEKAIRAEREYPTSAAQIWGTQCIAIRSSSRNKGRAKPGKKPV